MGMSAAAASRPTVYLVLIRPIYHTLNLNVRLCFLQQPISIPDETGWLRVFSVGLFHSQFQAGFPPAISLHPLDLPFFVCRFCLRWLRWNGQTFRFSVAVS